MILKLVDGKVLIDTMYVPELKEHTLVYFEMEPNTNHLQRVLYINHLRFTDNVISLNDEIKPGLINIKVELLDDKGTIVHLYQAKVAYNIYQVLGDKPIRPDIEDYLYKLEDEIRSLKNNIIVLQEKHLEETKSLNAIITELEEKGEIV